MKNELNERLHVKQIRILKLVLVLATLVWSGAGAQATLEVGASVTIQATADFNAPLSARGTWVEARSYGRCWRPTGVVVGWRPYCDGYWVWTDCGWYWQSDEPWAWACYHYGRWVLDPVYGWVWVPDVEWSPAWVVWRSGGGYIGWAPLAPGGVVNEFVFVEGRRFQDRVRPSRVIVHDQALLKRTTVINNITREHRDLGGGRAQTVVVNQGPGAGVVEAATGKRLKVVAITEAARRTAVPRGVSKAAVEGAHEAKGEPGPAANGHNELPDSKGPGESGHERVAPPSTLPAQRENAPPFPSGVPGGRGEGHGRGHEKD